MDLSERPGESAVERWFDGGLKFKCTGCGKCCTGSSGSVYLSQNDLERLAQLFRLPVGSFARKYTRVSKGRRVLIDGPDSHGCVFLADKICSVYEARPTQCRTYPFWLTNIRDPEAWQEAARTCEGIDHPGAPIVSASEVLAQCRVDEENEVSLERRRPA